MAHSFYVVKNGAAKSVDNITAPKKTNSAHGSPAGESVAAPVSKSNSLRSGNVAAGG